MSRKARLAEEKAETAMQEAIRETRAATQAVIEYATNWALGESIGPNLNGMTPRFRFGCPYCWQVYGPRRRRPDA